MNGSITRIAIRYEQDIVRVRQKARTIAEMLGFDRNDQTRLSTAVSEIARNAYQYAGGGEIEFLIEPAAQYQRFSMIVCDTGNGIPDLQDILDGMGKSKRGLGLGITGARRLMDYFKIDSIIGRGTTVHLGKNLLKSAPLFTQEMIKRLSDELSRSASDSPMEEMRLQNHELLAALGELRTKQDELEQLNHELEDTNRGVLALYAELDEKALQLGRVNELQSRFLSNMSHELRTPINSILALTRILLEVDKGKLDVEQERQVVFIRNAAENLSILVNDLLDLGKIKAGRLEVYPKEFSIDDVFSGLRGTFKPLISKPALKLTFYQQSSIPLFYTDESKLAQILRNFLSNALKFTDSGEIKVSVGLSDDNQKAIFAVSDTGIGIAPENLENIFDEYTQVPEAQVGTTKGTGLGLSISRQLADMLGGSLGVESCPGIGSTFAATIPIRYSPTKTEPGAPHITKPDILRYPVLVIDDDSAIPMLYESYLRGSGFQVLSASSIVQARQSLHGFMPTAIIVDASSQQSDALIFLSELRQNRDTAGIPVIITSPREYVGQHHCVDYFGRKPIERKQLLGKLLSIVRNIPPKKILVIADDEVFRLILKGHLSDIRHVIVETDCSKGYQTAVIEMPSVIILDLSPLNSASVDSLGQLKANDITKNIPVIAVMPEKPNDIRISRPRSIETILSKNALSKANILQSVRGALQRQS